MPAAPVFLIGFPGAGKSAVGAQVAAALGRPFVDLDEAIAATAGRPVPEMVVADEPAFRRLEAATLAAVAARADLPVVATGGGAAIHGDNLARMQGAGHVIALDVPLADALVRVAPGSRPLLQRPAPEVEALYRRRQPVYRRAPATVATAGHGTERVAAAVLAAVRRLEAAPRRQPWVTLEERSYPIDIGDAALPVALAPWVRPGRHAVVADANLASWIDPVVAALRGAGADVHVETVAPGEASKSLAEYGRLADALVAARLDRGSTVFALGGGVVGDLAGFVAATLYRGIDVVHLPTTLVAMTDSAIGGKTAIDLPAGKNLLGAFHQPRAVIAHLPVLATLPPRERQAGFGELWKYALLDGDGLWRAVAAVAPWAATTAPPPAELTAVIAAAATLKAAIVSADERERSGQRVLLNLGHTLGHAIEAAAGWALLHGEAVGLGLRAAARVSCRLGLAGPELEARVVEGLTATGLPTDLDARLTPDVVSRVRVDKKRSGGKVAFVACAAPGDCQVVDLPTADLADLLRP